MFRIYRKTICPRWHSNYKNTFEKKSQNVKTKVSVLCINSEKQNHSHDNHKKQHANKQDKRYWDDPHFHFNFLRTSLFETAGWLGTVAVCLNYHVKYINTVLEYEKSHSTCLFHNIVCALPRRHIKNENIQCTTSSSKHLTENEKLSSAVSLPSSVTNKSIGIHLAVSDSVSPDSDSFSSSLYELEKDKVVDTVSTKAALYESEKDKVLESADIFGKNIKVLSEKYSIAIENSVGVRNINKNDKKAFRSFQNAARHGSTAGFYNLGLCYQLGKGTKVNLNMAAYCYRRAALKGHGLASYNLAVFFHKGIGGLPVDIKIAKELLAEAAEKDVPEAQLYFGILFLEEKKWSNAVRIFSELVEKNIHGVQICNLLKFTFGNASYHHMAYVADIGDPLFLGLDFLRKVSYLYQICKQGGNEEWIFQVPDAQYYLGLCYENGLGVQKSEKVALELFKKSAEQGNKRAADKLKSSKKESTGNLHSFPKTDKCKITESSCLHPSMSVPELGAVVKKSNESFLKIPILSYLDLFSPLLIASNITKMTNNFYSNEKLSKEHPSTCHSFKSFPPVVMEVKSQL